MSGAGRGRGAGAGGGQGQGAAGAAGQGAARQRAGAAAGAGAGAVRPAVLKRRSPGPAARGRRGGARRTRPLQTEKRQIQIPAQRQAAAGGCGGRIWGFSPPEVSLLLSWVGEKSPGSQVQAQISLENCE